MNFVYFSIIHWDYIFQRPQHIASGLSKKNKVLYIDPIGTLFTYIGSKFGLTKVKKQGFFGKITKISNNLIIYSPPKIFLPFFKEIRLINKINSIILSYFVKKIIKKSTIHLNMDFKNSVLWLNFPAQIELLKLFNSGIFVFDCIDDYAYFFKKNLVRKNLIKMEKEMVSQVDLVLVTSRKLFDRNIKINKKTFIVPNAVEVDHFYDVKNRNDLNKPVELKKIKKPILGYIGTINWWIDLDLLLNAAKSLDVYIVLIGPVEVSISKYKNIANMIFLGTMEYGKLPNYIKYFDICILPMKINKLTMAVNPVKLYEYFASGKPVVSTGMDEIKPFKDICFLSENDIEFIENIRKILLCPVCEDLETRIKKGLETARNNSWSERIAMIDKLIAGISNEIN